MTSPSLIVPGKHRQLSLSEAYDTIQALRVDYLIARVRLDADHASLCDILDVRAQYLTCLRDVLRRVRPAIQEAVA